MNINLQQQKYLWITTKNKRMKFKKKIVKETYKNISLDEKIPQNFYSQILKNETFELYFSFIPDLFYLVIIPRMYFWMLLLLTAAKLALSDK